MSNPSCYQNMRHRLAVCSWSLQPSTPEDLAASLRAIGLNRVQLDLDPVRENAAVWEDGQAVLDRYGISIVSGMFRTVGEDYTTLESIRRTGGIVPDATWEQNRHNARITAENAARLGLDFVLFHAGFLPHDPATPEYGKLAGRVREIARIFAAHGIVLGCETGQEDAESLKAFLEHLDEPNVAVNFDPANMLLYNKGDPIAAMETLGPWVKGIHLKDGAVTQTPGAWGEELPVGAGRVQWPAFFDRLVEIGFGGWLCFEREAGDRRVGDIRDGFQFVRGLLEGRR
jgi:sugar phosphate isomerase/epimerase